MMKMLLADNPEARQLTIVPELARRLDGATRADLPFTTTPEQRTAYLGTGPEEAPFQGGNGCGQAVDSRRGPRCRQRIP